MANNFTVIRTNPKPAYTVKVNDQNGVFLPSQTGTPFVTPQVPLVTPRTIGELTDVIEINPPNNATLVFDSFTSKYIVKEYNIDGGTF